MPPFADASCVGVHPPIAHHPETALVRHQVRMIVHHWIKGKHVSTAIVQNGKVVPDLVKARHAWGQWNVSKLAGEGVKLNAADR